MSMYAVVASHWAVPMLVDASYLAHIMRHTPVAHNVSAHVCSFFLLFSLWRCVSFSLFLFQPPHSLYCVTKYTRLGRAEKVLGLWFGDRRTVQAGMLQELQGYAVLQKALTW